MRKTIKDGKTQVKIAKATKKKQIKERRELEKFNRRLAKKRAKKRAGKRNSLIGKYLSIGGCDKILFYLIVLLIVFGVGMVFSAAYYWSMAKSGSIYSYFIKMMMWAVIGLFAMVIVSNIDYHKIANSYKIWYFIGVICLALVKFTPLGQTVNGARRWLNLYVTNFQPSEMIKFILIITIASIIVKCKDPNKLDTLVRIGATSFVYAGFIMLQPNMSTAFTLVFVVFAMLFVAGFKIKYFISMMVVAVGGAIFFAISEPYRFNRIISFLDPFKDPQGDSFQVVQSLLALGTGELFGKGPGNSIQKTLYLPEPHTDFIMAIIGEELGFVGLMVLILAFVFLVFRGIKIAIQAKDTLGTLIASGVVILIGFQMMANVAIVTSSMPATGIGLPFISYGGTSIVFFCIGMGLVLNVSRQSSISLDIDENRRKKFTRQRLN